MPNIIVIILMKPISGVQCKALAIVERRMIGGSSPERHPCSLIIDQKNVETEE